MVLRSYPTKSLEAAAHGLIDCEQEIIVADLDKLVQLNSKFSQEVSISGAGKWNYQI